MANIIKLSQAIKITSLSRSSIYAMIKENSFPKPVLLGLRSVGWVESEIQDWVNARIESRNLKADSGKKCKTLL